MTPSSLIAARQGDYVALASEPHVIVGVDVAAPQQLRRGAAAAARPLLDALAVLRQQLTDGEVGAGERVFSRATAVSPRCRELEGQPLPAAAREHLQPPAPAAATWLCRGRACKAATCTGDATGTRPQRPGPTPRGPLLNPSGSASRRWPRMNQPWRRPSSRPGAARRRL